MYVEALMSKKFLLLSLFFPSLTYAASAIGYDHDHWQTMPRDEVKEFIASTASMDSKDDNDGLEGGDVTGTPEWVSYEIRAIDRGCINTKKRPKWKAEDKFVNEGIAPTDDSYVYSRAFRKANPDWYVRGHLQMKLIAERISNQAAKETHTFLNAVPQRSKFNSGIWLDMEYITTAWAQEYGKVWVITGPIYIDGKPSGYIGEGGEFKVAIPDALYKIVVKEGNKPDQPDVLAFVYPQVSAGYYSKNYDHSRYLTSVDEIEEMTGLDFLTILSDKVEKKVEKRAAKAIWHYDESMIKHACK
jgi:endonuclease G